MWFGKVIKASRVTQSCKEAWDKAVSECFYPDLKFKDLLQVVEGDKEQAEWMADDIRINLLSAHWSQQQWVKHWFQECPKEWVKVYMN